MTNGRKTHIYFIVLPTVQLLDLTGPVQAFDEARQMGATYEILFIGLSEEVTSAQGMSINKLIHFSEIVCQQGDIIFLSGIDHTLLSKNELDKFGADFYQWMRDSNKRGAKVCSVCNSAFVLAHSGLLDHQNCTTHWKRTQQLQDQYPKLSVIENCLFIKNKLVNTSAGSASGIDMALSIIEDEHGPIFTSAVAKELVLYMRRTGYEKQLSFYLDYRNHTNLIIHHVQDYIIHHPTEKYTIIDLADKYHISSRHLTRLFKSVTGITINEFTQKLRMEIAKELIKTNNYSLKEVSEKCGFENPRHFRRLMREYQLVAVEN